MKNAPDEKRFVFWDGKKARNIFELAETIEKISDQEFCSYVNEWKNDFAKWIFDVFSNSLLALKLGKEKSKQGNIKILKEAMNISSSEKMFFGFFKKKDKYPSITADNTPSNKKSAQVKEEFKHIDELKHEKPAQEKLIQELPHLQKQEQPKNSVLITPIPTKKKFFHFGSKKQMEEEICRLDDEFIKEDKELESGTEQIIWILLYGLLIGLIVVLLVYKFVFNGSLG